MSLSCLEISQDALLHNVSAMKSLLKPGTRLAAVVKGNAYGHGLCEVARALEPAVDFFQIDDLDELRALRRVSAKPALVLGYVAKADIEEAITLGCELAVYDRGRLDALSAAATKTNRSARLHLKIDALLGRQGLLVDELEAFAKAALAAPGVEVVSAYSHFANIEDTPDFAHAQAQIDIYHEGLAVLAAAGLPSLTPHLSSTSGVMAYEANAGSSPLVRCGIGTYGMYPSDALGARYQALKLEPAMRWVSHLAQVKTLPAGFPIGYGLTYVTKAQTPVGIVPQGYSDGYDRGLSNVGEVLVNGKRCRVLGRVAMNMFAVDLTNASRARQEDEVVLLGAQGADRISAEEVAERIGTINYEITTRVSALLPRVVV